MKKNKLPLLALATALTVFAMPGCGLLDWQNGDPTGGGTSGGNHGGNGGHGRDSSGNHGGGNGGNNGGGNNGGGSGDSSITVDTTVVWDSNYYNDSLVWFDTVIDGVHIRMHR